MCGHQIFMLRENPRKYRHQFQAGGEQTIILARSAQYIQKLLVRGGFQCNSAALRLRLHTRPSSKSFDCGRSYQGVPVLLESRMVGVISPQPDLIRFYWPNKSQLGRFYGQRVLALSLIGVRGNGPGHMIGSVPRTLPQALKLPFWSCANSFMLARLIPVATFRIHVMEWDARLPLFASSKTT